MQKKQVLLRILMDKVRSHIPILLLGIWQAAVPRYISKIKQYGVDILMIFDLASLSPPKRYIMVKL